MMKRCSKCEKLLEANSDNFHKDKQQKDGFTTVCKNCRLQSKKNYDTNNKTMVLDKARKRYHDNIDMSRQQSLDYYYDNLESCRERNKLWCIENPNERKEHKLRSNSKRRAVLNNCFAEHITKNELLELLQQYPNCPYCGVYLTRNNTQLDHIYPLSKGGQHTISNLMPCCAACNNHKQNKLPIHWILQIK